MRNGKDKESGSDRSDDARRSMPMRELAKKLITTGAEAVHLTEEGLKTLVGEVSPKEAVSGVFESVSKGTDFLQTILTKEARRYLEAIDLRDELGKLLSNYTIEVTARIHFVPRDKSQDRKRGKTSKDASLEAETLKVRLIAKDPPEEEKEKK